MKIKYAAQTNVVPLKPDPQLERRCGLVVRDRTTAPPGFSRGAGIGNSRRVSRAGNAVRNTVADPAECARFAVSGPGV
ncbi:hypothetical protein ACFQS1_17815 [Paractinoplanes rhizophilus]|uniref:Uncharacterized protein n=1 Tax=Paractinoplanes rhizophilus TaxID=1416877 RepID=A0ABW2HT82_9ACTN